MSGWWYVACNGIEGWAPATYLEKINLSDDQVSDSSEKDEIPCMAGGYTITNRCVQLYICMRIAGELFVMCRRCGYRIAQCKHSSMVVQDSLSSQLLIDNEMDSLRALPERPLE